MVVFHLQKNSGNFGEKCLSGKNTFHLIQVHLLPRQGETGLVDNTEGLKDPLEKKNNKKTLLNLRGKNSNKAPGKTYCFIFDKFYLPFK